MELKPLMVTGEIVAALHDDEGRVIRVFKVAGFDLYAPEFEKLEEMVKGMWPAIVEEHGPKPPPKPKRKRASSAKKGSPAKKRAPARKRK